MQDVRLWGIKLDIDLKAMRAVRSEVDPCLYMWSHLAHGLFYIQMFTCDQIVAGKSLEEVKKVKASVLTTFDVRDVGKQTELMGMKVMRDLEGDGDHPEELRAGQCSADEVEPNARRQPVRRACWHVALRVHNEKAGNCLCRWRTVALHGLP